MSEIISLEKEYNKAFARAKEVLSSGGVIIYPTDTVYGIGGDARKPEVVERIRKIKGKEDSVFSLPTADCQLKTPPSAQTSPASTLDC